MFDSLQGPKQETLAGTRLAKSTRHGARSKRRANWVVRAGVSGGLLLGLLGCQVQSPLDCSVAVNAAADVAQVQVHGDVNPAVARIRIERQRDGGEFHWLTALEGNFHQPVDDTGISPNSTYNYQLVPVLPNGEKLSSIPCDGSAIDAPPDALDTDKPATPMKPILVGVDSDSVSLELVDNGDNIGVTGFTLFRNTVDDFGGATPTNVTATGNSTLYADGTVSAGATYYYWLKASDAAQNLSSRSGALQAQTPGQAEAPQEELKLMPIGDSITHGKSYRASWRYPFQEGMADSNCLIDFVGSADTWKDGDPEDAYVGFDHDHEAHGGRTTSQAADAVALSAPVHQPDLALIHTGTNDVTPDGAHHEPGVAALRRMITSLVEANPNVQIYLAEIIPAGPAKAAETADWNTAVRAVAQEFANAGTDISTVDMFNGWNYQTMTVATDNIHPNSVGENFIADRWIQALEADGIC